MSNVDQAMIMAAGFGTRMMPLTKSIPKPMININGKSLIENILEKLHGSNICKIIINTHYLSNILSEHVSNLKVAKNLDIIFVHEEKILDSGGGVVNALSLFDNKPFFRINSDIYWEDNSIIENLNTNFDLSFDGLLGIIDKKSFIGYNGNGDFSLIQDKFLKIDDTDKQYVFSSVAIFSPKLFANLENKNFTLFGDYIFKYKKNGEGILENIYGLDLGTKIYHIDTVKNLEDFKNSSR